MDKKILIEFTKHLILASRPKISLEKKERKEKPVLIERFYAQPRFIQRPMIMPPVIPPRMPAQKPIPQTIAKEEVWEMGKLTKLVSDKSIDAIECLGLDNIVKIRRGPSTFITDIKLNEEEVKGVIEKFSVESKTPVEGVFRASAKGWRIAAISSPIIGHSFVMKRI